MMSTLCSSVHRTSGVVYPAVLRHCTLAAQVVRDAPNAAKSYCPGTGQGRIQFFCPSRVVASRAVRRTYIP